MTFTSNQLLTALEAMPSRSAAILNARCIKGVSRAQCADAYGIKPDAFDALLLGAANDLSQALGLPQLPFSSEAAAQLAEDLEAPKAASETVAKTLHALRTHASTLTAALTPPADEANQPVSPREKWIRRLAIIAILLLTAYFYWQENRPGFKVIAPNRIQR